MGSRAGTIALRRATPGDDRFLLRVYAGTREAELARVPWSRAEKDAFVEQQFAARTREYRERYPDASFDLVTVDGEQVGALTVARSPEEIRIVDIAILAERRGEGIGSSLLGGILDEARGSGARVTVHVERFNRARSLYERLGFAMVEEGEVYALMSWEGG